MTTQPLYLGVALNGAGWHPAAWRDSTATPNELFEGTYWARLARTAEGAGVDLLTIEDSFGLQSNSPFGSVELSETGRVRGNLDAIVLANYLAPLTRTIGLVPSVTTTHLEPFHIATAIQTLDHSSLGRAGLRPVASARENDAALVGHRSFPKVLAVEDIATPRGQAIIAERFEEAAEVIEAARRLWDSWQDDAVIRDVATGRYIDRDRLHYIDFEGTHFSVKGPSIVPRSPQGQPLITLLAHAKVPYQLAARSGDIVYVTPHDDDDVRRIIAELRQAESAVERSGQALQIWADALVLVEPSNSQARAELDRLDELSDAPLRSDAVVLADTAAGLAERLLSWQQLGIDGIRLRPARLPKDLNRIASELVPLLRDAGVLERPASATTLRARLGLPHAPNRYTDQPTFRTSGRFVLDEEGSVAA